MRKVIALFLIALMLLQPGCAAGRLQETIPEPSEEDMDIKQDTFLDEVVYDFSYEKPKDNPHILLNRSGYPTVSGKLAFFAGKQLPETFSVVDVEERKVVYTGLIENAAYDEDTGNYFASGDFSELEREGEYYLQAELIGRSYDFQIKADVYDQIYDHILESLYYHRCGSNLSGKSDANNHPACHTGECVIEGTQEFLDVTGGWHTDSNFDKDVAESTRMVSDLLLTYEFLYAGHSVHEESEMQSMQTLLGEVFYEVNFLLKMQDGKTGAFYAGVESRQPAKESSPEKDERDFVVRDISDEATAECAAVLAQFARVYKSTDDALSMQCLQTAIKAFQYLERKGVLSEATYFAACELYKTTGTTAYAQYILRCRERLDTSVSANDIAAADGELSATDRKIYGDIAYLTTTYPVNLELCTELMNSLMNEAEEVSLCAKRDDYRVYSPDGKHASRDILEGAFVLAVIDHIVT
ncbi:MAG: glycoside hydrolase family 9 protein, partial [Lachnospiraceae bacterium]|nr:glycoside hydrolase family 9 protein [Lachnospiraceae bacterium]